MGEMLSLAQPDDHMIGEEGDADADAGGSKPRIESFKNRRMTGYEVACLPTVRKL